MFCYNTKNALTADAIKKLSIMSILKERVKTNSDDEDEDDDSNQSESPDFLWVVRDYSLNSTLKPEQRLEKFLAAEPVLGKKNQDEIKERNEIRAKMKTSFNKMNCIYLPCPASDGTDGKTLEEALQTLDYIDYIKLRSSFRNEIESLCKKVKETIKPKVIDSIEINGPIFAAYIKKLIESINSNDKIYIRDNLNASIKLAALESLESVKCNYIGKINSLSLPIDSKKFDTFEMSIRQECEKQIKNEVYGNNQIQNEILSKFLSFINEKLRDFKDKNQKAIFDKNYNLAKGLWSSEMDPKISSFKSINDFRQFMSTVLDKYNRNPFQNYQESKDAWTKWIENSNINNIERTIEERRINEEKLKVGEKEKQEQAQKAKEEAIKRAELEIQSKIVETKHINLNGFLAINY